ncbi:isocitrate/isopropylmalate dehydrogenase [Bradyrhizobium sp. RT11b]|jgi:isocitrate/isopropylmalate dehydrogenase
MPNHVVMCGGDFADPGVADALAGELAGERLETLADLGGFPFPICTPAHGTAYDIAGQGIASIGASRAALLLAAEMAARRGA